MVDSLDAERATESLERAAMLGRYLTQVRASSIGQCFAAFTAAAVWPFSGDLGLGSA
jgi:hypothetical protein